MRPWYERHFTADYWDDAAQEHTAKRRAAEDRWKAAAAALDGWLR